jgi:hypothetical protein
MLRTTNQRMAYRALQAVWQGMSGDALSALFADGFRFRNVSSEDDGADLADLRRRIASLRSCHPNGDLYVEETVGSGDQVAFWWTFRGAGRDRVAEPSGHAPPAVLSGTSLIRLRDGWVVEICEIGGELVSDPC